VTDLPNPSSRGVALITGGARRIGKAIALSVGEAGFDVAVHHRAGADEAQDLVQSLHAMGRKAMAFSADLAIEAEVQALLPTVTAALGPVTLLINNASLFEDDRIETQTRASWDTHMEINLRAPMVLAQAMAASLPADREGLILNLLDQRVLKLNPQFFSYTLSKAALWQATKTLAQALAPRIRVNGIGPGPTLPSIHQAAGEFEAEAANTLLQRRADPSQIAQAVRYLIDARSVTGQMIAIDGGQHLAWRTPDIFGD
jgi:NAD(P)-dependent dehydrogenase (short-subunit alcohol dehydrogenase family)